MSLLKFVNQFRKNPFHLLPFILIIQCIAFVSKMTLSFYTQSFSLFVNSICTGLIILGKYILLRRHKEQTESKNSFKRIYKITGMLITSISVCFVLYSTRFFSLEYTPQSFSLIAGITVACITLVELIISISGIISARKSKNTLIESLKQINLVSSVISISLTQSALLSLAHTDTTLIFYTNLSSVFWGMIICMIGIKMMLLANRLA